jgi:hypothetical protein
VAIAVAAAVAYVWVKCGRKCWARMRIRLLKGRDLGLVVLFKLALNFFQIILLQESIFDVRFPEEYLQFLGHFQFLNFELPFESLRCFWRTNYHDRVSTAVAFSSIIMACLLFGVVFGRMGNHGSHFLSLCIVPSYLLYPSTSSVLFQTFNCRTIDQDRILSRDLSVNCDTEAHAQAQSMALVMIVLFCVGLPVSISSFITA